MSEPRVPETSMDATLGIEHLAFDPDAARARMPVGPRVLQPFGIVHGGAYATLAESLCSAATYVAVKEDGMVAMAQSNEATFLRRISSGHVNAAAVARHRGRTTWVWDCELTDDDDRVCALVRLTIAVRPAPPGYRSEEEAAFPIRESGW